MTETPTDFELETIRDGFATLGRIHGRYAAAKTLADKALEDAAHGELKWAGICNCEPEATPEEQTARAEAEKIIARVTEAYAKRPTVVVLCGSTRFYDAFQQANYDETMAGNIVLSVGFYPHSKALHGHGEGVGHDSAEKLALDELHLRKIDMADEVLVLNVGGYVGESTRREIAYATALGKPIRWLEEPPGERPLVACMAPDPDRPGWFCDRTLVHDDGDCHFVPADQLPASADDEVHGTPVTPVVDLAQLKEAIDRQPYEPKITVMSPEEYERARSDPRWTGKKTRADDEGDEPGQEGAEAENDPAFRDTDEEHPDDELGRASAALLAEKPALAQGGVVYQPADRSPLPLTRRGTT